MAPSNLSWEQSPRAPSNPGPLGAKAHRMPSLLLSSALLLPACTKKKGNQLRALTQPLRMCAPESVSSPKDQQGRHTQIPALKEANVHVPLTTTGGDLPPRVHRIRSPLKTHTNSGAGVRGKAMHTLGVSRGCDILSDQQAWKLT